MDTDDGVKVVENLVIESDNLMPNVLEFSTDNYWRWGRKKISNKDDHKVCLYLVVVVWIVMLIVS